MTINCKGKLIDLSTPRIMGILNVTPDSFYDGGKHKTNTARLRQVETMLKEGATFIDVGGYSSRPNGSIISEREELERVIPAIQDIVKTFSEILVSVDTFRSEVALQAVAFGASMVNDISAGKLDTNMLGVVAKLQVPYVMMHMQGTPQTMQQNTTYNNIIKELLYYFSERVAEARHLGILDLIIDPGFGFSKISEQNFKVLNQLESFKLLDCPILVGISRKSMIYKNLKIIPQEALNGTTVLNTIALQKGASILRVHDVKEAKECVDLMQKLN